MLGPPVYNPQAPPRDVMSHHPPSPPPPQHQYQYHHAEQHRHYRQQHPQHLQHLQYQPQHHHVHPQFYQQYQQYQQQQTPVLYHAHESFSGHHHQQQQQNHHHQHQQQHHHHHHHHHHHQQQQHQQQQQPPLPCACSRVHATSPSAFLSDCGTGAQVGWTTSSGAADSLEALAAAATSPFLASQDASRTMPASAPQYSTSPPSPFAAPPSPGHAQYFSLEPLIVSGPAGAYGRHRQDVAPASQSSYPLKKATSGGKAKPSKRQRDGHSDGQQSKRAHTPEGTTTAVTPAVTSSALNSNAFQVLSTVLVTDTCQPGQEGARVGLLPGLRPEYMQTYEKEEKKRRAPREDLSMLTAEEKVERRKARARVYSHHARKRDEAKIQALAEDVDMMQVFRFIVEDAPGMIAVISPDLDCSFLFANEAFGRVLGFPPRHLLGRPLWLLVHPKDESALTQAMTATILAPGRKAVVAPLSCRLACNTEGKYVGVEAKMTRGTQGVVCSFSEMAQ